MRKIMSFWSLLLFFLLILFRSNIIIFFSNIFNLFQEQNNFYEAEIKILKEKTNYLEKEIEDYTHFNNNLGEYANYNYFLSKVLYKENYFYNAKVLIKGGEKEGIKKGMAVVNELGMVGIVGKTNKDTSELIMLTNANNISVNVRNSYGKLEYVNNKFKIDDISKEEDVRLNDEVYTSTLGNIKEKIYIGKVVKVNNNVLEKEIIVESSVDFNKLNYLLVVGDLWFIIY